MVVPHRRDQDPAAHAVLRGPLDLGDGPVDVVGDRDERHAGASFRAVRAQLDEEPVVRTRARERELGVRDLGGRQARAERRRRTAGDRVGVREHHLARDAVGVELLVALGRVERAAQTFGVLLFPLRDVVVAVGHALVTDRVPLGHVRVERVVVLAVEVRAVLLARKARVAVRRDDQVPIGRVHDAYFPSTERSS